MGEEYGEAASFHFFTSFLDPALTTRVREGRRRELARLGWTDGPAMDPALPATLDASRLDAALETAPGHRELREYYRAWLTLRREHPALGCRGKQTTRAGWDADGAVLTLARAAPSGEGVRLVANLSGEARSLEASASGRILLDSEARRFGGAGGGAPLGPWQVLLFDARG
jgi:maltooligosyltrehalose trehalohydrolase